MNKEEIVILYQLCLLAFTWQNSACFPSNILITELYLQQLPTEWKSCKTDWLIDNHRQWTALPLTLLLRFVNDVRGAQNGLMLCSLARQLLESSASPLPPDSTTKNAECIWPSSWQGPEHIDTGIQWAASICSSLLPPEISGYPQRGWYIMETLHLDAPDERDLCHLLVAHRTVLGAWLQAPLTSAVVLLMMMMMF